MQLERARRLLAHEASTGGAGTGGTPSAARIYDTLSAHLAPLLGAIGVQLLFVRSAKLVQGELSELVRVSILDGAARLRERLQSAEPPLATESAVALFATFLTLITTFIGERLTAQILRTGWPTLDEKTPAEKTK